MSSITKVSYTLTSGTVATPQFSYSAIGTLGTGAVAEIDQFVVRLNDVALVADTDYTFNTTSNILTVIGTKAANLVVGDILTIRRETERDEMYVVFEDNSGLVAEDLNLATNQLLFIVQEGYNLANNALQLSDSGLYWNGRGLPSSACGPATTGTGWTTLNQVRDLIGGGDSGTFDNVEEWTFVGDGIATTFSLNGAPCPTSDSMYFVTVDGAVIAFDSALFDLGIYANSDNGGSAPPQLTVGQSDVLDDEIPPGTCITLNATARATVVAALTDVIAAFDAVNLIGLGSWGIASNTEFTGTLQQALAFFTTGAGNAAATVYLNYCARDVRAKRLTYTVDCAADTITFNYPPPQGSTIQVRLLTGTVRVFYADNTINGSAIIDSSLSLTKLSAGAGASNRVLVANSSGVVTATVLTSSIMTDFAAAVQANRLDQMTNPTASVNMNSQVLINLGAGTTTGDSVNWTQWNNMNVGLAAATTNLTTDVRQRIGGGYKQEFFGIQPDLYFQTRWDLRALLSPPVLTEGGWDNVPALEARIAGTSADPILTGFVPRRMAIMVYGGLYNCDGSGVPTGGQLGTVSKVFRFERWDLDSTVGFTPWVTEVLAGTIYRYRLSGYDYETDGSEAYDGTGLPSSVEAYLDVELVSPFRTWFRLLNSGTPVAVCKASTPATPGVIQIIAEKGS